MFLHLKHIRAWDHIIKSLHLARPSLLVRGLHPSLMALPPTSLKLQLSALPYKEQGLATVATTVGGKSKSYRLIIGTEASNEF